MLSQRASAGCDQLFDVDWRPRSTCDEGLIVGSDAGGPDYGLLIRFYDADDADCSR
jgi:hypothetical protein